MDDKKPVVSDVEKPVTLPPEPTLTPDQEARTKALESAHYLLTSRSKGSSGMFASTPSSVHELPENRGPTDLVELANYIITGVHYIVAPIEDKPDAE